MALLMVIILWLIINIYIKIILIYKNSIENSSTNNKKRYMKFHAANF